ncbi:SDR family NAD(P)-dependent oxidoreductase [Deinococcus radiophilus]|uniref:SDR family NAD(P)-dependent oxidoreductase n=1 Tax=Deinococcus radiophilus TaxID=32062 RepID=A0A3S0IDP2_9DEIO|nr:SDR family NAD(P)-dependent oxidoreductase [Deinococcus radiophilus]RTR30287.1 SDR family NAD(P)-dependent oxidoreductase [Deinococcus radiophilus]UFA49917.1 SDR family NAD(P)-dependent oxidoreductase [Deinococcus radiophilus]
MRLPKRLLLLGLGAAIAARHQFIPRYDLTGKSVLITGGSRGLGLALAREFAARGARLTLLARSGDDLERAAAGLREQGAAVTTFAGDVTQQDDLEGAIQQALREYGALDVVVNNAGIIQTGPVQDMTEDDWREIMEVNAFAPLRLIRAAYPQLKTAGGRVLIVSSVGGKVAVPHLGPYSMSKFASAGLGAALNAELARDGISVTTVLPALMQTGSPKNAVIKGDFEKEYAWFATLDNTPLVSMPADTAARQMVDALVRGDAETMIGLPALALKYAQALAPQLTADLMGLTNRLLPGPTGKDERRLGAEAETELTRNNPIKRAAEERFNQDG